MRLAWGSGRGATVPLAQVGECGTLRAYRPAGGIPAKLRAGYQQPTYEKAKASLKKVRAELATISPAAVASLGEGFKADGDQDGDPKGRGTAWAFSRSWGRRSRPPTASRTSMP